MYFNQHFIVKDIIESIDGNHYIIENIDHEKIEIDCCFQLNKNNIVTFIPTNGVRIRYPIYWEDYGTKAFISSFLDANNYPIYITYSKIKNFKIFEYQPIIDVHENLYNLELSEFKNWNISKFAVLKSTYLDFYSSYVDFLVTKIANEIKAK